MLPQIAAEQELFDPGDLVVMNGAYELVDELGNSSDHGLIFLEEGDFFPDWYEPGMYWRMRYALTA